MSDCNTCIHNKVCAFLVDKMKLNDAVSEMYNKFPDVFTIDINCKFYTSESTVILPPRTNIEVTPDMLPPASRKLESDEHIGDPKYIQVDQTKLTPQMKPPRYECDQKLTDEEVLNILKKEFCSGGRFTPGHLITEEK